MPATTERVILKCSSCDNQKITVLTARGTPRIQSQWGWKRRPDAVYCKDCWEKKYRLVAIILPIRPVDPKTWPQLRPVLAALWSQSTRLANWAIHELAVRDHVRLKKQEKMAKMEPIYLYGLAKDNYPDWGEWSGKMQGANAILRMAESRYRRDRYKVLWTCEQNCPTYRYGVPFPLDADAWKVQHEGKGPYLLSCSLGERWTFVLQTGNQPRQHNVLKQILAGTAIQVEAALYERRRSLGDHRAGTASATPGGGHQNYKRLFAKLVCWVPRSPDTEIVSKMFRAERKLHVRTGPDMFWHALLTDHDEASAWRLHADHVGRWIVEYMLRLGRLSDDSKYEKRWPKRQRAKMAHYREALVAKHHRRIDTWIKQAVASLVNYATRQGVTEVLYDESRGHCCNPFVWERLRTTLAQELDREAIAFTIVSGEVAEQECAENNGITVDGFELCEEIMSFQPLAERN